MADEKRGEDDLSFPQRNLFDKIGIRSMVIEADPYGNFLTQGHEFMAARLGNLYLQDGQGFDKGERMAGAGLQRALTLPMEGLPRTR